MPLILVSNKHPEGQQVLQIKWIGLFLHIFGKSGLNLSQVNFVNNEFPNFGFCRENVKFSMANFMIEIILIHETNRWELNLVFE